MTQAKKSEYAVLTVEDNADLLLFMTRTLEESGFRAVGVQSAREALEAATEAEFGLAVIDIGLPDIDGIELGRRLASEHNVPYLCVTGRSEQETVERAARAGAVGYLIKPVDADQLVAAVRTAMSRSSEILKLLRSVEQLSADNDDRKMISIAVGVIMERYRLINSEAFDLLRYVARSRQEKIEKTSHWLVSGEAGLEFHAMVNQYIEKQRRGRR